MKQLIPLLLVIAIFIAIFCLGIFVERQTAPQLQKVDNTNASEWISPDGVHYWIFGTGYRGYMAVKYDSDGNVVIDK